MEWFAMNSQSDFIGNHSLNHHLKYQTVIDIFSWTKTYTYIPVTDRADSLHFVTQSKLAVRKKDSIELRTDSSIETWTQRYHGSTHTIVWLPRVLRLVICIIILLKRPQRTIVLCPVHTIRRWAECHRPHHNYYYRQPIRRHWVRRPQHSIPHRFCRRQPTIPYFRHYFIRMCRSRHILMPRKVDRISISQAQPDQRWMRLHL